MKIDNKPIDNLNTKLATLVTEHNKLDGHEPHSVIHVSIKLRDSGNNVKYCDIYKNDLPGDWLFEVIKTAVAARQARLLAEIEAVKAEMVSAIKQN